jgi:hypothetical protein
MNAERFAAKRGSEPPASDETKIEFELRDKWWEILAPKTAPDVNTEITATTANSKWVLRTDSSDLSNRRTTYFSCVSTRSNSIANVLDQVLNRSG